MRSTFASMAAIAAFSATPAFADPVPAGQFSGSISVGTEFAVDGDVHGGGNFPVGSLAALNPNLPDTGAQLQIGSRSYDDVYGELTAIEVQGAWGVAENRELFFALRNAQADRSTLQVGNAIVPALNNASLPVFGTFGDLDILSAEVGVRQYLGDGAFKPYGAARVGVATVDEIRATFTVPVPNGVGAEPNDIVLSNVAFYDESTAYIFGVDVGVSYDVTDRFSLAAETGLRFQGELEDNDSAIGPLGLGRINDEGDRISVPVTARGTFRF